MADLNSTIVRGNLRVTEDINTNGSITGNGSELTNLNASNISSGTLSVERLDTSGAKAGSYGPSTNATPSYGAKFNVPYITIDNKGRVTAAETKTVTIPDSDNTDTNTSHGHSAGIGLVGSGSAGTSGENYTYKAKLRSETALTIDSVAATTTLERVYPVAVDKSGYLSVNVPWVDTDTHIAVDSQLSSSSTNPVQNKAIYSAFSSTVGFVANYYYFGGSYGCWRIENGNNARSLDIRYGTITINSQSSNYNVSFRKGMGMNNANYTVVFGLESDGGKQSWFWSPIVQNKGTSGFTVFLRGNSGGDNAGTIMYIAIRINAGNN